jgi:Zn-dependent protease with chaperone function
MKPIRSARLGRVLVLAVVLVVLSAPGRADEPRPGTRVSRYDIATRDDLLFSQLVAPTLVGDVAEWSNSLLGGLPGQVGDWVTQFLDARALAGIITEAFPVEGQPALAPVERLVAECSRTLDMEMPLVHVRNSYQARGYTVVAGGRTHLVLTSRLLELFEGRPGELKFAIGRELGHVKCDHAGMKAKAFAVFVALQGINSAVVPDRYQNVLPTLGLGRLLTWYREAEISSDRAGLLCCGEPKVAYEAIMRFQHGLRADSPWIDPEAAGFDPRPILEQFQEWQYRPLVGFLLDLKRHSLEQPYYQERLAALKIWADTGAYRRILARSTAVADSSRLVEVLQIQAHELAAEGQTVSPYVIVLDRDQRVLKTVTASKVREAKWSEFRSSDKGVDQPRAMADGQPLFFEIWDDGYTKDSVVGGFVIYPRLEDGRDDGSGARVADYSVRILWDWKESGAVTRPGHAQVRIRFSGRQEVQGAKSGSIGEPKR